MAHHPFEKVLVAVDGSFHASIAARYSITLTEAFGAKLYVVTVLTKEMDEREEKSAAVAVERIVDEAGSTGIEVEGVLLTGDVVDVLKKFVEDNGIELVVASTRRPHRDKRFFVRSITSALMSGLSCSVIGLKVSHPGRSIKPRKILIPVIGDGYRDKERADIAEAMVRRFDSMIVVFHVVELTGVHLRKLDRQEKERMIISAEKKISSFTGELKKRALSVSEKIAIGRSAREEIISEASHQKYDLIIVGATTRNILKRMVSGSPVEEILRDTPCDVMLIHFK